MGKAHFWSSWTDRFSAKEQVSPVIVSALFGRSTMLFVGDKPNCTLVQQMCRSHNMGPTLGTKSYPGRALNCFQLFFVHGSSPNQGEVRSQKEIPLNHGVSLQEPPSGLRFQVMEHVFTWVFAAELICRLFIIRRHGNHMNRWLLPFKKHAGSGTWLYPNTNLCSLLPPSPNTLC